MTTPHRFVCVKFSCLYCGVHHEVSYVVAAAAVMYSPPICCERLMRLEVAPLGIQSDKGWLTIEPSAGVTPSVLDVIPVFHRDHKVEEWARHAARRGWRVGCSCGAAYNIDDHPSFSFKYVEEWFDEETQTVMSATDDCISGPIGPDNSRSTSRETTTTSMTDMLNSDLMFNALLDPEGHQQANDRAMAMAARLRSAMAAMSNVMHNVLLVAGAVRAVRAVRRATTTHLADAALYAHGWYRRISSAMAAMANVMRCIRDGLVNLHEDVNRLRQLGQEAPGVHGFHIHHISEQWRSANTEYASDEWSRRVRAGVAAQPKPGAVVYCEGDYDDE